MLFLLCAAVLSGALNAVAGGGSFIGLPALIYVGIPAVSANATNAFALLPGSLSSALGYRRERGPPRPLLPPRPGGRVRAPAAKGGAPPPPAIGSCRSAASASSEG